MYTLVRRLFARKALAAGVMQLAFLQEYGWLPREQELLRAAAERCVMAAQKQRLIELPISK